MRLRRRKGMTQAELARKMNTSIRMISYYERAMKNPELATIEALAKALEVPVESIWKQKSRPSATMVPNRSLQKKLNLVEKLPKEDQMYIAKTIDLLAERNGIAK